MGFKEDFSADAGWRAADVSVQLNNAAGGRLLAHFRAMGVDTLAPTVKDAGSGISCDRNVLRTSGAELGAFQVDADGHGQLVGGTLDASLEKLPGQELAVATPLPLPGANRFVTTEGLRLRSRVEVTPDVVRVLGGNVDDTVLMGGGPQEYGLDPDGYIKPGQRVIAVLKNRAGVGP